MSAHIMLHSFIKMTTKDRNVHILSNSQVTIKALNNFRINSKLVWDCPQSLMKLAEHNVVQLVGVPG